MKKVFAFLIALTVSMSALAATEVRILRQPKIQSTQPVLKIALEMYPSVAKEFGINDLVVTTMSSAVGAHGNDAMLAKKLDIVVSGTNTYGALENAIGADKTKVLTWWSQYDYWLLCNDPTIKTVKDFKPDTKVAFKSLNAGEHIFLRQIAKKELGDHYALDKHVVVLPRETIQQLFEAGNKNVTCAIPGNPVQNNLVRNNKASIVYKSDDVNYSSIGLLSYSTTEWISANETLALAWVETVKRSVKLYNEDTENYLARWAEWDQVGTSAKLLAEGDKENRQVYTIKPGALVMYLKTMKDLGLSKTPLRPLEDYIWKPELLK